jgi:SAM-dependent methyltransferase
MAEKHFFEQQEFTRSYLIPYFRRHFPAFNRCTILEVGSAEGGFLDVLQQLGIDAKGLELEAHRIEIARQKNPSLLTILGDITDPRIVEKAGETFDLIVMRDVIEHIPDRLAVFQNLTALLKKDGYLYITFPPRFSAFAGHQQNGRTVFKIVPFLHLLPDVIIRLLGRILNEKPDLINSVIANYKTGLSIRWFEKMYRQFGYRVIKQELFLSRPIFKVRFGFKIIKCPNIFLLREVLASSCEALLQKTDLS